MKTLRSNRLSYSLFILLLLLSSSFILAQDDDYDIDCDSPDLSDEDYEYYCGDYYYDDYDIDCDSPDLSDEDYEYYCGDYYYDDYDIDCDSPDLSDEDFEYYCIEYVDCDSPDLSDEDYEYYCEFDYEDYIDDYGDFIESDEFDSSFATGDETALEDVIGQFEVSNTTLEGTPENAEQALWVAFTSIVPFKWVSRISTFEVIDDPDTSGYVYVDDNDPSKFVLGLNIDELNDPAELNHTIVHELAHIITLNMAQVSNVSGVCPALELDEGCTNTSSYINQFNSLFWETNASGFVSDYASTNVAEDIAESFAAFVLYDKPTGDSVTDQKINFFYNYPNLVQLRQEIRANING